MLSQHSTEVSQTVLVLTFFTERAAPNMVAASTIRTGRFVIRIHHVQLDLYIELETIGTNRYAKAY